MSDEKCACYTFDFKSSYNTQISCTAQICILHVIIYHANLYITNDPTPEMICTQKYCQHWSSDYICYD